MSPCVSNRLVRVRRKESRLDFQQKVSRYYDANSKRFIRFGRGGQTLSIHRAVWAPGITTKTAAFLYHEERLFRLIQDNSPDTVVDLGCGVGGSLAYLSERYHIRYHGITISSVQAQWARSILSDSCVSIHQGSYLDEDSYPPFRNAPRRFFYAIESYLHCHDKAAFFETIGRRSNVGDTLVICDDFVEQAVAESLSAPHSRSPGQAVHGEDTRISRIFSDFRLGWQADCVSLSQTEEFARRNGFSLVENTLLNPWLEIDRARDYCIAVLVPLLRPFNLSSAWWLNMLGGNALRTALKNDMLQYRFTIWRKTEE